MPEDKEEAREETLEQLGLRYLAAQEQRLRVCQREKALKKELAAAMRDAGKEAVIVGPKVVILHPGIDYDSLEVADL